MKKKCFIDIEANQLEGRNKNFLLEFSIYTEEGIIKKLQCNHQYGIKNKIKYLLNLNDENYYKTIKLSEKDCYKQLLKYAKEYDIYTYGNYDQVVLNDVAKRYQLGKIKLIDYSKQITKTLKIHKNNMPSIRSLRFALNIELENIVEHDSLSDVKVLKSIYDKVQNSNEVQKQDIKQKLDYELLRPRLNAQDCYAHYVEQAIDDNYTISILEFKVLKPIIQKKYIDDIDKYIEEIIANRREEYTLTIYDNKANLLDKRIVTIDKDDDGNKPTKTARAIKELNLNLNNTVLICNKSNKKIFETKDHKRIFNVVNCVSLNIYQRYKSTDINNFIKTLNMFYENNKFDKVVDYSSINLF